MVKRSTCLTVLSLAAIAGAGTVCAQEDPWYSGISSGFSNAGGSLGFRAPLPGTLSAGNTGAEAFSSQKQYGGYRVNNAFAIEGAQTSYGNNGSACVGEPAAGEAYRPCYGSTWSLAGVATFQGLSLYGRLGLHYWSPQEEPGTASRRGFDDFGRVMGVGLSYEYSKRVTLHAESELYNELSGGSASGPRSNFGFDSSVHSIGLSIKF